MTPSGDVTSYQVRGLPGLPEVQPGDDLAELIAAANPHVRDGDILVVSSKIVSKAEGRLRHGTGRDDAIDAETVRVVAEWTTPRGRTRVAETQHGFVLAAAGVDASNVATGSVVLLPEDPDGSARTLRQRLRERLRVVVGVVITDTAGRPWRDGVTDFAVGAAGLVVRHDLRGRHDSYGNELGVTVVAVADELAAASELARGKLDAVPVAVIRGLASLVTQDDGPGAATLVRPAGEDRFQLGTPEAMRAAALVGQAVEKLSDEPVEEAAVRRSVAIAAGLPTPLPAPWRFVLVRSQSGRSAACDAMEDPADPQLLRQAPYLVVPFLVPPDEPPSTRPTGGTDSYLLSAGAMVQALRVALAAEGLTSVWTHTPLQHPTEVRRALDVPEDWLPLGAVAVGRPAGRDRGDSQPPPDPDDTEELVTIR